MASQVFAATGRFTLWQGPAANTWITHTKVDSKGKVWYIEYYHGKLNKFDPDTGVFTEWKYLNGPWTLDDDPNSEKIWFGESSGRKIGVLDPTTDVLKKWSVPGSYGVSGVQECNGALWFTRYWGSIVGRFTPETNTIEQWTVGRTPLGIACNKEDGTVTFGEYLANKIATIDPETNTLTEWTIPTPLSYDLGGSIEKDSEGNTWFNEGRTGRIGKLDSKNNLFTEWQLPDPKGGPYGVGVDLLDNIWFGEYRNKTVGLLNKNAQGVETYVTPVVSVRIPRVDVVTPSVIDAPPTKVFQSTPIYEIVEGVVSENAEIWPISIMSSEVGDMEITPSGDVFFTDDSTNKVGRLITYTIASIDIKPNSFPNSINPKSQGLLPVGVLSSDEFDATTVDSNSILFAGTSPVKANMDDVNDDGLLDMVLFFEVQSLELTSDDESATLYGKTVDGNNFRGSDSVRVLVHKAGKK